MTNMIDTTRALADHAAAQSDRWLLVYVLIAGAFAMVVFWRWMISDRDKLAKRLTDITDRHIDSAEKQSIVVANNTAALHQNTEAIKEMCGAVAYCKQRNQKL